MAAPGFPAGAASFAAIPPSGQPNGVGDSALSGFPTNGGTYAILTTGSAAFADDPNNAINTGVSDGGGNVRGNTDFDVTVLRVPFTMPQGANCLTFDFKFLSDEYPEFVGSEFNDAFIAELDTSNWTTSGSTITAPNNFAFDPSHNVISINASGVTSFSAANAAGTTYDGATPRLSASKSASPGAHTLFLSIFDQGDHIYDSAVFLDALSVGFVPDPAAQCVPGATPFDIALTPATATNQVGTNHTVSAKLTQGGAPLNGKTIKFTVTGANPTSGTGTTNAQGNATFTYTGHNAGNDTIVACYDANNDGKCEATATAKKTWQNGGTLDKTPPTCVLATKTATGITVNTQDTGTGLQSVVVTKAVNTSASVPAFASGTKSVVTVAANKINLGQSSELALQVTDVAGNVTNCDPIMTTVLKEPHHQAFTNVPSDEHVVTVTNGTPGLRRIALHVNDQRFVQKLAPGQTATLDIGSALLPGDANRITIRGWGKGSADVIIWDGIQA